MAQRASSLKPSLERRIEALERAALDAFLARHEPDIDAFVKLLTYQELEAINDRRLDIGVGSWLINGKPEFWLIVKDPYYRKN